jgi:hypothetical protein
MHCVHSKLKINCFVLQTFNTENVAPVMVQQRTSEQVADPMGSQFEKVRLDLEQFLQSGLVGQGSAQGNLLHSLHETMMVVRGSRDPVFGAALVQRAMDNLLESAQQMQGVDQDTLIRYREINLCILKALQDPLAFGVQWTNKHVARYGFLLILIDAKKSSLRLNFQLKFETMQIYLRPT